MISYFLEQAPSRVLHPIKDKTNQSVNVDDNLGAAYSNKRKKLSGELVKLSNKIQKATKQGNLDKWTQIVQGS